MTLLHPYLLHLRHRAATAMRRMAAATLAGTLLCHTACTTHEERRISPLGITDTPAPVCYDLDEIQACGELIAVTLTGPDTYYEYRGQGMGAQYDLAEDFARHIGVRLRMETARDTATLLRRLAAGEADLIALDLTTAPREELALSAVQQNDTTHRGWLIREDAPLLAEALQQWYSPGRRKTIMAKSAQRIAHRNTVRRTMRAPVLNRAKGIISPYDKELQRHSAAIGWDWRLMAAQCYQESGFDPQAVSWAGARGLMQIMPETATHLGLAQQDLHHPQKNIAAAARYLSELDAKFRDVGGRAERLHFVLAAYNGGAGHVRDAMTLVRRYGGNPYQWNDVAPYLLRLSQPAYYNAPEVQYGYMRGEETVNYVTSILQRWAKYRGIAPGGNAAGRSPSAKSSHQPEKSKVRSAEEIEALYHTTSEPTP